MLKTVFADADGTLHPGFSIFPLFDALDEAGLVTTEDNENLQEVQVHYEQGQSDYADFVKRTLNLAAHAVRGKRITELSPVVDKFYNDPNFRWFGYVVPTLAALKQANAKTILMTAEPQFIADGIASALGFDDYRSSIFATQPDKRLTGQVSNTLSSQRKGQIAANSLPNVAASRSYALGDSEGDIGMLSAVNYAFCIKPTPGLKQKAKASGWNVVSRPEKPKNVLRSVLD